MRAAILAISLLVSLTVSAFAKDGVKVGDAAPALSYDEWIKGDTVTRFARETVYLVEFWGTWCKPCIKNIPHLSTLQKQYAKAGLVVIGVASHEFKEREVLTQFMKERGATMEYRVAFDKDQSLERDWDTGGKDGVTFRMPLCFIVNKSGRIALDGHPEDESLEPTLKRALSEKP